MRLLAALWSVQNEWGATHGIHEFCILFELAAKSKNHHKQCVYDGLLVGLHRLELWTVRL